MADVVTTAVAVIRVQMFVTIPIRASALARKFLSARVQTECGRYRPRARKLPSSVGGFARIRHLTKWLWRWSGVPTRIKICGITRVEDAIGAAQAGADALGFVFYPPSPRYVSPLQARAIVAAVSPFVTTVALFVNESAENVRQIMAVTRIQLLQFHGDEDASYCEQFQRPYIKAIRMAPGLDPQTETAQFPGASGYLLDTWKANIYGGTGEVFDWRRMAGLANSSLILAGGLTPANVAAAIGSARPGAVDVSGGVESAPGCKDRQLIEAFVAAVQRADAASG